MSANTLLSDAVLACLDALPSGHVRTLIAGLRQASGADAGQALLGAVPTPAFRQHAAALLDAWQHAPALPAAALALALECALASCERELGGERLQLVATGPGSPHVSLRQTRAVLLEVIDGAARELIVVSYAAYKVPALVSALERARQRGATVRLVLESSSDSAGALTYDGAAAFEALRDVVEMYVWPLANRRAGARLHAKVAVADATVAFVTSANLTGRALDQNLEIGVLVNGGTVPRRLSEHFQALIAKGTLHRM